MFKKPKYLLVTALFIIASLALAACGGAPANQPVAENTSSQEDAPETGASVNESNIVEVQVTLNEFSVDSSVTIFDIGVPYRFTITNNGMMPHELMLIPQLDESITGVKAGSGMEPGAMMNTDSAEMDELMEIIDGYALAVIEEDDLYSGAIATFDHTFTEPTSFGELEFACYVPGHYEAGMFLPILVQ